MSAPDPVAWWDEALTELQGSVADLDRAVREGEATPGSSWAVPGTPPGPPSAAQLARASALLAAIDATVADIGLEQQRVRAALAELPVRSRAGTAYLSQQSTHITL